ncbi:DUF2637 domain-containing protein [Micromonospora krabiensis]|uniref:DUF2637 domain-containing protein n=1 Tax=Micromonospora krabiensis TaxID=307121 RepID=A0A1C3N5M8_9ACTN|nr:DUF2637 domain-containing protein [Micromonospora krabiensis]SBV27899.1 Protein of unknown function [Micromonospora krabiensis]
MSTDKTDDRTLKISRAALAGIATVAAVVSYFTQRDLLLDHEADELSANAIPLTVDLAVIMSSLVINTPGVDQKTRRLAWGVLSVACAVSIVANCYAGDNLIQRIAHVWCVVIYLGAEAVASRIRMRRTPARKAKEPAKAAKPAEKAPAPEGGQEVVVSAIKPARPRATGPRGRTKVTPIEEIEATKTEDVAA